MKLFFATFFVCVFSLSIFAQGSPKSAASPEPVNPAVKEKAAPATAIIPAASVKEITGLQKDVQIANLQAGNLQLQSFVQNRQLREPRPLRPLPQLAVFNGTEFAAGVTQLPDLQIKSLWDWPIPAGSTVGIYGSHLLSNGITKVWITVNGVSQIVEAQVQWMNLPNLEMVIFILPSNTRGDLRITTAGRRSSNSVRLIVE